jgi:hypothetical protein
MVRGVAMTWGEASRALWSVGSGKAGFGTAPRRRCRCRKGPGLLDLAVDRRKYPADVRAPALFALDFTYLRKRGDEGFKFRCTGVAFKFVNRHDLIPGEQMG